MIRIGVCDDEVRETQKMTSYLEEYISTHRDLKISVKAFTNPSELLDYVEKNGGFDILFLDVYMQGMLGTELAKEVRNRKEVCDIIFLTTSRAHAVDAYALEAMQYITKPYTNQQIIDVLEKAICKNTQINENIVVKTTNGVLKLNTQDILFSCTNRHYQSINMRDGTVHEVRLKGDELFQMLGEEKGFIRCGISYIVGMKHIKEINSKEIVMDNEAIIPIIRGSYKDIRQKYMDYMFN